MSETAHTKTPWAIGHTGARIIAPALPGFNGSPFRVADANSSALVHSASFEEAKANAAFIVRAVNAHGPLVAALRDVRGHFKTEMAPDGRVMSISHDSEALPKVIAALDAALSLAESSP